jgi:hypothetical protein
VKAHPPGVIRGHVARLAVPYSRQVEPVRGDDVEPSTATRLGLIVLVLASIVGFYVGGLVGFFLSGVFGPGSILIGAFVIGPLLAIVVARWTIVVARWTVDRLRR